MGISVFVAKLATPNSGKSMARVLMAALVLTVCAAIIICARKYGFGDPMAKAIEALAIALGVPWGISNSKWGIKNASTLPGTKDEEAHP